MSPSAVNGPISRVGLWLRSTALTLVVNTRIESIRSVLNGKFILRDGLSEGWKGFTVVLTCTSFVLCCKLSRRRWKCRYVLLPELSKHGEWICFFGYCYGITLLLDNIPDFSCKTSFSKINLRSTGIHQREVNTFVLNLALKFDVLFNFL